MHVLATTIPLTSLAAIAVVLRLYTRLHILKRLGYDDYTIIAALISSLVFLAFLVVEVNYGLGTPTSALSPTEFKDQLWALWWTILCYNLSLVLTKISILLLYLRIFPESRLIVVVKWVLAVIIVYSIWIILSSILFCIPVRGFWDFSIHARCFPKKPVWMLSASLNIATDLTIFLLPMPVLTTLTLPWRQKIGVVFIFVVGLFVCIISIIRLTKILELAEHLDEFSQLNNPTATWSSIESNLAILCACMPSLRPIYSQLTSRSNIGLFFCREKKIRNGCDASYFYTHSTEPHNSSPINSDDLRRGDPTRDGRETV